jgi:hypothetical protein
VKPIRWNEYQLKSLLVTFSCHESVSASPGDGRFAARGTLFRDGKGIAPEVSLAIALRIMQGCDLDLMARANKNSGRPFAALGSNEA